MISSENVSHWLSTIIILVFRRCSLLLLVLIASARFCLVALAVCSRNEIQLGATMNSVFCRVCSSRLPSGNMFVGLAWVRKRMYYIFCSSVPGFVVVFARQTGTWLLVCISSGNFPTRFHVRKHQAASSVLDFRGKQTATEAIRGLRGVSSGLLHCLYSVVVAAGSRSP